MIDAELNWVDSTEDAYRLITWLGERRPLLGMDTETEGLKLYAGHKMRLFQVGDAATGWAVSLNRWRGLIEDVIRRWDGPVAFANAKFDLHALLQAGLPTPEHRRIHDTVIMSRLLEPTQRAGLKEVGERYFPGSSVGQDVLDEAKHKGKWTWATIPEDNLAYWSYSAWDPSLACRIAEAMWPRINNEGLLPAYDREMAVQGILFRAERRGMKIDPVYTANLKRAWDDEMAVLLAELEDMGLKNPSSGRQIAAAMAATEKWDPSEWTPTGEPKVDKAVLKGIDSEISRRVLRFRRLKKWTSTYLNVFLRDRDADDLIHASINTLQARTGRMSITGPPLQTLPSHEPEIRNCVSASPGGELWAIDQKNVEMRVFAHFSQDPALMQAARDDLDLHKFTASLVYGCTMEEVTGHQRAVAKQSVSFGKLYGAGIDKVAEAAEATIEAVETFLAVYGDKFPGVERFTKEVIQLGRERLAQEGRGYVRTWGGRLAPCDEDRVYALVNYLIQGSCADLFKHKIIQVDNAGFGDNIVLPVHDELLFDFPEGPEGAEMAREAAEVMEERDAFSVPLTVDLAGPFERWGDHTK